MVKVAAEPFRTREQFGGDRVKSLIALRYYDAELQISLECTRSRAKRDPAAPSTPTTTVACAQPKNSAIIVPVIPVPRSSDWTPASTRSAPPSLSMAFDNVAAAANSSAPLNFGSSR